MHCYSLTFSIVNCQFRPTIKLLHICSLLIDFIQPIYMNILIDMHIHCCLKRSGLKEPHSPLSPWLRLPTLYYKTDLFAKTKVRLSHSNHSFRTAAELSNILTTIMQFGIFSKQGTFLCSLLTGGHRQNLMITYFHFSICFPLFPFFTVVSSCMIISFEEVCSSSRNRENSCRLSPCLIDKLIFCIIYQIGS